MVANISFILALSQFWFEPWFVILAIIIAISSVILLINKNKTYNDDYVTPELTNFSLETGRLFLLFAAFMPSLTGFAYCLIIAKIDATLAVNIFFGVLAFIIYAASFKSKFVINNLNKIIVSLYSLFVLLTLFNSYITHLHSFYFSTMLVTISIATVVIDKAKPFTYFAIIIGACISILVFTVSKPLVPALIFLFCTLCEIIAVYLMILIKLNLNDKLLFADDVINNGNSLVIAANANGKVVYASKNFERILGFTEKEILGDGWWNIRSASPEDNYKEQNAVVDVEDQDVVTNKVIAKDKSIHWIKWLNKRMKSGLVVGIGSDVTEKYLLEERYQNMVENASDIIYTTNSNGVFIYTNTAAVYVTGYEVTELIGINYLDLIHPAWKNKIAKFYYNQVITNLEKSYCEFPIITKQNKELWIGQTVSLISSEDTKTFVGFQSVARDITTRVMAQQELEENRKHLEIRNAIVEKILAASTEAEMISDVLVQLKQVIPNIKHYGIAMYDIDKNVGVTTYRDVLKNYEQGTSVYDISTTASLGALLHNTSYDNKELSTKQNPSVHELKWLSQGVETVSVTPIFINGTLYGAINLLHTIPNAFTPKEQQLLREIANNIAINISRVRYSDIISEINKDVSENIAYATRIQQAIIPPDNYLTNYFPKSFLYLQQRDKLGGDFYFATQRDQYTFLAVGDCTGHGVSGALLTILSINYLTQAISELRLTDPALIIEHLNNSITTSLNKNNKTRDEIRDGLDLCMCVIDHKAQAVFYAGAMNAIYTVHNSVLTEYKGTRMPIGGILYDYKKNFYETHVITYTEGMNMYITTDGYTDQFEPITQKKYGRNKFKQLLQKIAPLSSTEQKNEVRKSHEDWKRNATQTDDVCVVGLQF